MVSVALVQGFKFGVSTFDYFLDANGIMETGG